MNKIAFIAILFLITLNGLKVQAQQLCYNPSGNDYYDCSNSASVQRSSSSSSKVNGNKSSANTINVTTGKNSTVIINNQSPQTGGVTPANQTTWQNRSQQVPVQQDRVWYTDRGAYYVPQQNQQVYYPNNSGVYPNGYYPAVPVNQNPGYYGNSGYYNNQGYYNQPVPTPYWHEQKSSSVVHDIDTNAGNPGSWWSNGRFSPRSINVNYRVRIQQTKTSVRGSTVNGQVPYVYNTGIWP